MKPKLTTGEEAGSIYLHIPFCKSKCAYCAFNSYPVRHFDTQGYLEALNRQLIFMANHTLTKKQSFATLFIGGGTPTVYSGQQLRRLITSCLDLYHFCSMPEITVETNPNQISLKDLIHLKKAGVNRMSIGIQSFSDTMLKKLGRTHTSEEALNAINLARRAGFDNINLDLMYGLPGQNLQNWQHTLETALKTCPEHLALYELTVEPETPFGKMASQNNLDLPNEDEIADMEAFTLKLLKSSPLRRYEISNYAKTGYECRHNLNYWKNGSYLGLGAGAFSCLKGTRLTQAAEPNLFQSLLKQDKSAWVSAECLSLESRFRESVIMGLRLTRGLSVPALKNRFQLTPRQYYGSLLDRFLAQNYLEINPQIFRLRAKALSVANQILRELV